jgi:putative restriction endonuclease
MKLSNGLCLSATYDAAFDKYLISFDEDSRLVISPALRDHYENAAFKDQFCKFEGQRLKKAIFAEPSSKFLSSHREKLRS